MTELTGMDFTLHRRPRAMQVETAVGGPVPLEESITWGTEKQMAPWFEVTDEDCIPLAHWPDGGIAAAEADHGNWRSLYCGTGRIPAEVLAHALRRAGVHIWTPAWRNGANFWAGGGVMGIHTSRAGSYEFTLPWPARVTDPLAGGIVLDGGRQFTMEVPKWRTRIFRVTPR